MLGTVSLLMLLITYNRIWQIQIWGIYKANSLEVVYFSYTCLRIGILICIDLKYEKMYSYLKRDTDLKTILHRSFILTDFN